MLDDHGAGVARRVDRREADEQRVVALPSTAAASFLRTPVLALRHGDAADLTGAGLAAHLERRLGDARA